MVLIYLHALTMIASVWSDRQRTDERPYSGHFSPTFLINFLTFYINIRNVNYSLKTQCLRCRGLGWWDSVTRSNTQHVVRYRFQSFKPRHPKFTVYDHRERKISSLWKLKENSKPVNGGDYWLSISSHASLTLLITK